MNFSEFFGFLKIMDIINFKLFFFLHSKSPKKSDSSRNFPKKMMAKHICLKSY